jgi:hypothetical protein
MEMQWNVGAYAPVGQQRRALMNAPYYQLAALAVPVRELAFVGSAGWAPTHAREGNTHAPVDVIDLDGGLEVRPNAITRGAIVVKPFAGLGLGARSYNYLGDSIVVTALAGYTEVGLMWHYASTGVRLSASDHVSRYNGIDGRSRASTRHELIVIIGLIARAVP